MQRGPDRGRASGHGHLGERLGNPPPHGVNLVVVGHVKDDAEPILVDADELIAFAQ